MNKNRDPEEFKIEADPESPDFARLAKLVREIESLGYDEETAAHYAVLIGDNPIVDTDGSILVVEGDKVLAKFKLKFFPTQS
jgi:hypothetical protein